MSVFIASFMRQVTQMMNIFSSMRSFATEEEGAQVLEYALIIAVLSVALILTLRPLVDDNYFGNFLTRLGICLTSASCV
jgi:pilus assembly protein Flp/PilA